MNPAILVGVGGTLGALARHLVGQRVETDYADTLAVNVIGSFLLGTIVAAPVGDPVALAFGTGFCGAFTTFSTFAFETVRLYETGKQRRALANASVHLVAALVAVGLGSLLVGIVLG
ncbi:CrcB protein [Halorhabdus utahensis DSM 12940]|uniref:Fluoride-specific ion channel FluC n=1 Tax=Halorhabdus utahensis (strain DSM 12940 / JCM 11049 / AX-2) TaxID=519442 RepID=C7NPH2_HALUD|nr:CrcB family protein [Halorhabdus utahensis]ACV12727.1 CrcB protein [Halorhabdus utahensis DSM 12940]